MAATKEKAPASATEVTISAEALESLGKQIDGLDTQISAATGSDTAAKKSFAEQIAEKHSGTADKLVNDLVEQLLAKPAEELVALVTRLEDSLKSKVSPKVQEWIDTEFPKTKTASPEDVGALRETRKGLLVQFKALREVLNTFRIDNAHVADPKRSGGGRPAGSTNGSASAKSGKNKEGYRYSIDGKVRPKSQNSFSSVSYYATEGCPKATGEDGSRKRWGAEELKKFITENGVNFGADDTFEVKLPNDKTVSARRINESDLIEWGETEEDQAPEGDATPTPKEPETVNA